MEEGRDEIGDVNAAILGLLVDAHRSKSLKPSPGSSGDELRIKMEYLGEKRSILVQKPLKLTTLLAKIRDMYGRDLTVYYTVTNSEIIVPLQSQEDLEKALSLVSSSSHMRSLRLLLSKHSQPPPDATPSTSRLQKESGQDDDSGRFSPPPGTSVRRARSTTGSRYSRGSSKRSEGEFIPEEGGALTEVPYRSSASSRASSRLSTDACSHCSPYHSRLRMQQRSWTSPGNGGSRASSSSSSGLVPDFAPSHSSPANLSASPNSPQAPSNWRQGRCLGSGAFGSVYLCYDADTSRELAVKRVLVHRSQHNHQALRKEVASLENEIRLLKNLEHERVVQYLGFTRDEDSLCIFMEYMAGGSVKDEIRAYGPLKETVVLKYTRQILQGLTYLHHYDIIHRDIKCANILRDGAGNVKIGDFGSGKRLQNICSQSSALTFIGTIQFMAPECVSGKGYGRKADLWSLGCSLVEMLSGSPPWRDLEPMAAIFRIASESPDLSRLPASPALRALVLSLFHRDPTLRPHARDALQIPLLQP